MRSNSKTGFILSAMSFLTAPVGLTVLSAIAALLISSCDVHYFPKEPVIVPLTLNLEFNTELPLYKEITYSRASTSEDDYDIRYIVQIYSADEDGTFSRTVMQRIVETKSETSDLDHSMTLNLAAGNYRFMVWADYVDAEKTSDKFYGTSDFAAIGLLGDHVGCNDFRDAFCGSVDCVLSSENGETVTVELERPMAKYIFIANDLADFVDWVVRSKGGSDDTKAEVNIGDYDIVFYYTGYMPCTFNMYTDRPSDSSTGVTFNGVPSQIDEDSVLLGFDYVFVNGTESSVSVALSVFDNDGIALSTTGTVEVPIIRSSCTIVTGNFLTSNASGAVGIDPGFEGSFNIEL